MRMKDRNIFFLLIKRLKNLDFKESLSKRQRDKDKKNGKMKSMIEKEEESKHKINMS
jgi:hypothetical protein